MCVLKSLCVPFIPISYYLYLFSFAVFDITFTIATYIGIIQTIFKYIIITIIINNIIIIIYQRIITNNNVSFNPFQMLSFINVILSFILFYTVVCIVAVI